jgi:Predicted glycosyltransferases
MDSGEFVGIVTVTYNSGTVLDEFLNCIWQQTHGRYLLFCVDNASKDNTLEILNTCSDQRLRVIANAQNLGVAEGNNQGIRAALAAGCSSVLLINNDTEFPATLIEELCSGLHQYSVDMICPKMMFHHAPDTIWAAGGAFQLWRGGRSVHFGEGEIDYGQYDLIRPVDYVPTCCVLIRKSVFESVGLMDERYFVYWDDTDFMYRCKKAGVKLLYLPTAKLLHKAGSLTGGGNNDSPFAIRFGTRNSLYFMLRHFGMWRSIPWLVLNQAVWLSKLILTIKPKAWYQMKQSAFKESLEMWRSAKSTSGTRAAG